MKSLKLQIKTSITVQVSATLIFTYVSYNSKRYRCCGDNFCDQSERSITERRDSPFRHFVNIHSQCPVVGAHANEIVCVLAKVDTHIDGDVVRPVIKVFHDQDVRACCHTLHKLLQGAREQLRLYIVIISLHGSPPVVTTPDGSKCIVFKLTVTLL